MADKTQFEIPEQMRAFADKSVDQAKKAFDEFMGATAKAVEKSEASAKSVQSSARDVNRQALAFLEANVAASFDFAQQLVRARTVEEIAQIQQAFLKKQAEAAQTQTRDIAETIGKAATDVQQQAKK
ncbi:phasin [Kaistia sp. 32K]|uniref:phasin family protein n=1 Tax=Kaistia sp. 32K TaxID=2795690 RepID=UPI001915C58F|nr:phasin family protein [Kaistia sp. 32K]BCP52448.1 phasin [Kaistia sp. 32K]